MPNPPHPFRTIARRALATVSLALALTGCATPPRQPAVPAEDQGRAQVLGMPGVRYTLRDGELLRRDGKAAVERERAALVASGHRGPLPPISSLALSGGGDEGAFGAGLLVGWTASGDRPSFRLVTGVSTGALIAPFAFLGSGYDAALREVYTEVSGGDIFVRRWIGAAIWGDSLADVTPLRRLIVRHVDRDMLDAIRVEYARGRVLLIATADLDSREPVLWNIGKIAESGHASALELVQDLLVASAAIPGAFPPVMIDVEVDGRRYQEMHVDGGTLTQVFGYPQAVDLGDPPIARERRLYVIRNGRLDFHREEVPRRAVSIVARSVSALIQSQGYGDLIRIAATSERDGIDFRLAFIPRSFDRHADEPFDRDYMNALFEFGYGLARGGYPWATRPPRLVELVE